MTGGYLTIDFKNKKINEPFYIKGIYNYLKNTTKEIRFINIDEIVDSLLGSNFKYLKNYTPLKIDGSSDWGLNQNTIGYLILGDIKTITTGSVNDDIYRVNTGVIIYINNDDMVSIREV